MLVFFIIGALIKHPKDSIFGCQHVEINHFDYALWKHDPQKSYFKVKSNFSEIMLWSESSKIDQLIIDNKKDENDGFIIEWKHSERFVVPDVKAMFIFQFFECSRNIYKHRTLESSDRALLK